MIGFNYLGKMGQLGNQMFQYASLKGIARKHGYEFCIPNHDEVMVDVLGNKLRIELFDAFDLREEGKFRIGFMKTDQMVQEPTFHFCRELLEECPDDVCIVGYLQTEKYFTHIEDEIRKDFTFRKEFEDGYEEAKDMFDNPVALHIRRGDFIINHANHHNLSLSYYEKALKEFDDDMPVVVFSDSIDWVKEQDLFKPDRFMISEQTDKFSDGALVPYIDLCLMTLCDHAIIANSSMSWWGAWLIQNEYKKVVAPKMWFGPAYADKDTKDLYPKGCIVI